MTLQRGPTPARRMEGRRPSRALALALALALASCGGSSHSHAASSGRGGVESISASVPGLDALVGGDPGAVVARVGAHVITRGAFAHAFGVALRGEGANIVPPVPPVFSACVRSLRATAAGARSSPSALRESCKDEYETFAREGLQELISQQWVISGAAEAGVKVSEAELRKYLQTHDGSPYKSVVLASLARYGETVADLVRQTKVQLLAEGIRHRIRVAAERVSHAEVVAYYDAHRQSLGVPPEREIDIVRAASEAEALKLKREIATGRSFASVLKGLPLQQPIFSTNGVVGRYRPGLYRESPLDRAIFAAKRHALSGPVKIFLGYYVFEVKRTFPPVHYSLAQEEGSIGTQLQNERYKKAFTAFVAGWRARWRARTDCSPGYVVSKCSDAPVASEDPFTLD